MARTPLLLVLLLGLACASPAAWATDPQDRQRLAADIAAMAADHVITDPGEFADTMADGLRRLYGPAYTPYADAEARAVARATFATPSDRGGALAAATMRDLSPEEMADVAAFYRFPATIKLQAALPVLIAERDPERGKALFKSIVTDEDAAEMTRLQNTAGMRKFTALQYDLIISTTDAAVDAFHAELKAGCASRTAPLPWCHDPNEIR